MNDGFRRYHLFLCTHTFICMHTQRHSHHRKDCKTKFRIKRAGPMRFLLLLILQVFHRNAFHSLSKSAFYLSEQFLEVHFKRFKSLKFKLKRVLKFKEGGCKNPNSKNSIFQQDIFKIKSIANPIYSLKINELVQSSQAEVYFFQFNSC